MPINLISFGSIQNLKQLEQLFPILYLDSSNGETVIITSGKEVNLIRAKDDSYLKFALKINASDNTIFYLSIHPDGDCWDYITNCAAHPYESQLIIDEC